MFVTICNKLQFPQESIAVLDEAKTLILANSKTGKLLKQACAYLCDSQATDPLEQINKISVETGIHPYTTAMVVFLYAIPMLQDRYRKHNLPEQLLWDSMMDLNYKLKECKAVENIWGTAAASWHMRFYWLQLFKLGRLEYEKINYRWDTPYLNIQKGDPVINIHIPSCGSLSEKAVLDSLKCAFAFYKDSFPGGSIPFVCSSWLLYPPMYRSVFPEDSNLMKFYGCFDILEEKNDSENQDFWRIFNRKYTADVLDAITPESTLQHNLLAYLKSGGTMGLGKGAFLFDGQQIIHV